MSIAINESIKTGVIFDHELVRPAWFVWGGRRYDVRAVTQRWSVKAGRTTILHLGVTDGASVFELTLDQETLHWRLASVATDGGA